MEQNKEKLYSVFSPPDYPAVYVPSPDSYTNLLQSMVTQNSILGADSESRSFVHNHKPATFTDLLQSMITQSGVFGGQHSQQVSTNGNPMNSTQINCTGYSEISSTDSDSEG